MNKGIAIVLILFGVQAQAWKITQLVGDVKVNSEAAKLNRELQDKDVITTGESGKALLEEKGAKIFVAAKSKISLAPNEFSVDLGKIRGLIEKQMDGKQYPVRFRTPTAVMGVRGTEFFIAQDETGEKFCTLEGVIHVELAGTPKDKHKPSWWNLEKGQGLFLVKGKAEVKATSEEQRSNWLKLTSF